MVKYYYGFESFFIFHELKNSCLRGISMNKLVLHDKYTREDVHAIFDGGITKFTAGAGIWGLHGIVKIYNRTHDYVFFVTIGQDKLGVTFKESLTEDGILTWQSQKRHTLNHDRILEFIAHDYTKHNIYLFLRPDKKQKEFRYMGRLAYVDHDPNLEQPVHFKWQVIDWEEEVVFEDIEIARTEENTSDLKNSLTQTAPPQRKNRKEYQRKFNASKSNYIARNEKNSKLGLAAELLVLRYEKEELLKVGRADLANKVIHTSVLQGDGAGYDIQSFKSDGTYRYIEVKATKGGIDSEFFISPNELAFSEEHPGEYELIRVYDYNLENDCGKFYKIEGSLTGKIQLKPTQYSARV